MKKCFTFLLFIFISNFLSAHDYNRDFYEPSKKIRGIVKHDKYNEIAYQLLRSSENQVSKKLRKETIDIWKDFKYSHLSAEEKDYRLKNFFKNYPNELTSDQLQTGKTFHQHPFNVWERLESRVGTTLTNLLKFSTSVGIISTLVMLPAASALIPVNGSFNNSCINISHEEFQSTDSNFQGFFHLIKADCRYDREDHGLKNNSIIFSAEDTCQYLHNKNGTLIATDKPLLSIDKLTSNPNTECPPLTGSFTLTCAKSIKASVYLSSDNRIPNNSVCQYDIQACLTRSGEKKSNKLYLPKASISCQGDKIENCDGTLVIRKKRESDSQCENVRKKHDEL